MKVPEITLTVNYKGAKGAELVKITKSSEAAKLFRSFFNDGTINFQEEFMMLCMNTAGNVIGYYRVSKGGMVSTVVDIRVIAIIALQTTATKVMVAHNHPSGGLKPSEADINITRKINDGLRTLDIELVDHFIITDESYLSMADEGII